MFWIPHGLDNIKRMVGKMDTELARVEKGESYERGFALSRVMRSKRTLNIGRNVLRFEFFWSEEDELCWIKVEGVEVARDNVGPDGLNDGHFFQFVDSLKQ